MSVDFTGSWKNQNNSTLELQVTRGIVHGRFESGVGDDGETLWEDVSGRVLDDVITFNVVYSRYGTVVAWIGQHIEANGIQSIRTHWLHATNIPDDQEKEWMWYTNRIGYDEFRRTSSDEEVATLP